MLVHIEKGDDANYVRLPQELFVGEARAKRIEAIRYEGVILLHAWKARPRSGWNSAMITLHRRGEDQLLMEG